MSPIEIATAQLTALIKRQLTTHLPALTDTPKNVHISLFGGGWLNGEFVPVNTQTSSAYAPVINVRLSTLSSEPQDLGNPPLYMTMLSVTIDTDYADHEGVTDAAERVRRFGGRMLGSLRTDSFWSNTGDDEEASLDLALLGSQVRPLEYNIQQKVRHRSVVILRVRYYSREG